MPPLPEPTDQNEEVGLGGGDVGCDILEGHPAECIHRSSIRCPPIASHVAAKAIRRMENVRNTGCQQQFSNDGAGPPSMARLFCFLS